MTVSTNQSLEKIKENGNRIRWEPEVIAREERILSATEWVSLVGCFGDYFEDSTIHIGQFCIAGPSERWASCCLRGRPVVGVGHLCGA
jgi:hypothetical protein